MISSVALNEDEQDEKSEQSQHVAQVEGRSQKDRDLEIGPDRLVERR